MFIESPYPTGFFSLKNHESHHPWVSAERLNDIVMDLQTLPSQRLGDGFNKIQMEVLVIYPPVI